MMNVRTTAILVVGSLAMVGSAHAASILDKFVNTGRNATNTGNLSSGAVDARYDLFSVPSGGSTSLTMTPHSAWLDHTTYLDSKWIGPREFGQTESSPAGVYKYRYTFDLTGYDASTVSLTGRWATDNTGVLYLNGTSKAAGSPGFASWASFTLTGDFVSGVNTLEFWVTNASGSSGNPTGLRVEYTEATASPVPEPATMALGGLALAVAARRRKRRA